MGDRPPGNWRMPRHMPRPMPPQQNPQATNVSHLTEMSLAIATQNRQSAEIIERFCANMTNESRLFNRRDSRPEYNNDYVELATTQTTPTGQRATTRPPTRAESDFSANNPYGVENIIEVPVQDNQAPYQGNNQTLYEGGGNNQFSHGDHAEGSNNQTPYGGGGSSETIAQAETSNQGKELLPNMRERERDSQDSQPRNDRSRSPPPQRERECHRPRAMIQPKKRRG
ncbi:hypothetical protein CABS01_06770 [Colletotrichum abscissum]|uniref:Uncharacterized protein n=1 Tax=Colletotrichum abscissum TaxID=1671311 RepID=A0A9P9X8W4_9PEZI|nr:uncharacterized protein CABS01_06770 [Colletotrichum abscissum]KAI3540883.1 hypothetical protein CABS02_10908 [Colletotrichum abscissum]KAK1514791.1 hypothetical protein CABS01_06770 [Colletotrichum abscissum]